MIKEKLKYIDTPKYPNVNQNVIGIIEKRLKKIGYEFTDFIDGGAFGKVFLTNKPDVVCKITKSDIEAYISELILQKGLHIKSLPEIYGVYSTKVSGTEFYVILMEKLFVDNQIVKFLDFKIPENIANALGVKHLYIDSFIQCYALLENIRTANLPSNETSRLYKIIKEMQQWEVEELIEETREYISRKNIYFSEQFINIIKGIQFLKNNDISYGDIAARNMLRDSNKNFKIIDFGYSYISNNNTIEIDEL